MDIFDCYATISQAERERNRHIERPERIELLLECYPDATHDEVIYAVDTIIELEDKVG